MGFIRGGLLSIVCILLFLSFLVGSIFLIFSLSLDYKVFESNAVSIMKDIIKDEINFNQSIPLMERVCQNNTHYAFNETKFGKTVIFPCPIIFAGSGAVVDYGTRSFLKQVYYDEYSCGFLNCLNQKYPFVLISQKAQNYWKSKFYFLLIASIILIILMFLLIENKFNLLTVVGGILVISAIPLKKLEAFLSFLIPKSFEPLFSILIIKSSDVIKGILIIGVVLIITGIVLRLIGSGFIKRHFSKEEVKEIVKKEVEKVKNEEVKNKPVEKSKTKKDKSLKK